jgi:hypothetical protein
VELEYLASLCYNPAKAIAVVDSKQWQAPSGPALEVTKYVFI